MYLNIFDNAGAFVAELREKGKQAPLAVAKSIIEATAVMFEGSRTLLSELVYNKPIPTYRRFRRLRDGGNWRKAETGGKKNFFGFAHSSRKSTKAAWRRTSTLLRNERYYFRGSGALVEGVIDNKTPYAQARHDLKKKSPYPEYDNHAPWRAEALKQYGPRAQAVFRAAFEAIFSQ